MKVTRKISPSTVIEAEAPTVLELFEILSQLEEIFRAGPCGCCGGTRIKFRTRCVPGDLKFHEAVCDCGAALGFGQKKHPAGVLFPQRKDAEGNWKPNGGWAKWQPAAEEGIDMRG